MPDGLVPGWLVLIMGGGGAVLVGEVRVALLRSAPGQGVSRPPHTASRDCRTAHPLPVRSRVRLHRKSGSRGKRNKAGKHADRTMQPRSQRSPAFLSPSTYAAQRAVPGWRGGMGRVGADLASAGSMRPPPSPARHVSTARLAPQTPGNKRQRETPPHQPADKPTAKSSCLVTLFHSEFKHS